MAAAYTLWTRFTNMLLHKLGFGVKKSVYRESAVTDLRLTLLNMWVARGPHKVQNVRRRIFKSSTKTFTDICDTQFTANSADI